VTAFLLLVGFCSPDLARVLAKNVWSIVGEVGVAGRGDVLATTFLNNLHYDTRVASWRTNAVDANAV